jgi:hypothetical protein
MLNEKLFSLAWFWLIYTFLSNLFSFLFTLYDTLFIVSRYSFIRDLYRTSVSDSYLDENTIQEFTRNFLMQDGVLILEILYRNGSAVCTTRVVNQLLQNYHRKQLNEESRRIQPQPNEEFRKIQPQFDEESGKFQPQFTSSDV